MIPPFVRRWAPVIAYTGAGVALLIGSTQQASPEEGTPYFVGGLMALVVAYWMATDSKG